MSFSFIIYFPLVTDTSQVDAAVAEQDPHMRIAYVAAFAMSNYSSTIGRIAKPFNPMLVGALDYHVAYSLIF